MPAAGWILTINCILFICVGQVYVTSYVSVMQACCTEAGMFALRERRVHVTQEDFEMAVAKVMKKDSEKDVSLKKLWN